MRERMKTVSVALVLCLNIGTDPPDSVKTANSATKMCWFEPASTGRTKAREAIGAALEQQYHRWQQRARYKQALDPTVEEAQSVCVNTRR